MAVAAVAGLATATAQGIATGFVLSTFATTFAVAAGLSMLSQRLLKPKIPDLSAMGNRSTYVRQAISETDIVYGTVRQSGPVVYIESTDNDKYLHMVIALAGHEVESIDQIYIYDELLTLDDDGLCTAPSKYAGLVRVKKHTGSPDQDADADLVAESNGKWTNAHRLRGVAYIYARLEFDSDSFPSGIPNISTIVSGKKLYDPRTDTTVFSSNPALVVRDYLTNSDYGLGATDAEIDDQSFKDAADICDESVSLSGGGAEDRYTANGVISTSASPQTNLEQILTALAGSVYYVGGTWSIKPATHYQSAMTLTEDDLRGSVDIQTRHSRRDNFNGVKGIFIDPEASWQPTDFPAVISDFYKGVDGGIQSLVDVDLPMTTSSATAQRIAKVQLLRQRQQLAMTLPCSLKPMSINAGDVIKFTSTQFGFDEKEFEVIGWTFNTNVESMGVDLNLRETSSTIYDWDAEERELEQDNTNLPDPFTAATVGVVVTDDLRTFNEDVTTFLIVDVTASNQFSTSFEVEARKSGATNWVNLGRASGNRFELPNVQDGADYEVRARAITSIGIRGPFNLVTHNITGKTAPPSDVTDFKVNITGTEAHLTWTAAPDLDLSHYRIRHSSSTSGASYSNAQDLARKVSRPATSVVVPAKTGTYFIKAVDKLGFSSTNAAQSVAIINQVNGGNVVSTLTESPSFAGTKTDCEVVSSALLITAGNSQGTYIFDNDIDLGGKYQVRLTNSIAVQRFDRSNLFDSQGGLFDSHDGLFDGDVGEYDDIDTAIQVRHTDDDPSGSPTWSDWRQFDVGEYAARAFQFRLVMSGDSTNVSPQVTSLSVTVDMPDRVIAESDVVSGASSKVITFTPAFKSLQGLGIAASNMVSGDYYEITSKTDSGFTITFKNSSDIVISRTFDYVARGYGEVI